MTSQPNEPKKSTEQQESVNPERRKVLGTLLAGGAALTAGSMFASREEVILAEELTAKAAEKPKAITGAASENPVDGLSGASRTATNWAKLSDLKEKMATTKIKGITISRMIMGGNLIGGWAHARDLLYVSELVKAYHTREKIFATFQMGEACGVNTYMGHHSHIGIMEDYWKSTDGAMQYISDCSNLDGALNTVDRGAVAAYLQGEANDRLVREGKFDEIEKFLTRLKEEKVPVGLGAHHLETIQACVDKGFVPDFWMKTIHHGNYWSRRPDGPERDNVYCRKPEETIAYMNNLKQPWIGFKVLAAGSIHPKDGFKFAFGAGADVLCVGMYDFQVVDDVNICMDILNKKDFKRQREWCVS